MVIDFLIRNRESSAESIVLSFFILNWKLALDVPNLILILNILNLDCIKNACHRLFASRLGLLFLLTSYV